MGRLRSGPSPLLPASLDVYQAQLQEFAEAQDDGLAYFGEAVYPAQQRVQRAAAFYPILVDPPDPTTAVTIPQPSEFYVPQPDLQTVTQLLRKPMPRFQRTTNNTHVAITLPVPAHLQVQANSSAAAPAVPKPPKITRANPRRGAALRASQATNDMLKELGDDEETQPAAGQAQDVKARDLDDEEVALVEMYREDKMSWPEIAALEEFRDLMVSGDGLRKRYAKAKARQREEELRAQMQPAAVQLYTSARGALAAPFAAAAGRLPAGQLQGGFALSPAPTTASEGGLDLSRGASTRRSAGAGDRPTDSGTKSPSPDAGDASTGAATDSRARAVLASASAGSRKRAAAAVGKPTAKRPVGRPRKLVEVPLLPEPQGGWEQYVNRQALDRAGGDARVTLYQPLREPSPGFTGHMVHNMPNLAGVTFYQKVQVVDPEEHSKVYAFDLREPQVCPCFHSGTTGPDGSPVLTWSQLHALYMLPDGTMWAEHSNFVDEEDLQKLGQEVGRPVEGLLPLAPQELLRKKGRYHSQLQLIEFECLLVEGREAWEELVFDDNTYFWERTFDPVSLELVVSAGPAGG